MVIVFNIQKKLHFMTENNELSPSVNFGELGNTIYLTYIDGPLNFQGPTTGSFTINQCSLYKYTATYVIRHRVICLPH